MSDERAERIAERRVEVLASLQEVDRQLAELRALRQGLSDDDEHDPDGFSLSSEWSRLEGLRQAAVEALTAIEHAAVRLANGEHGICVICGGPIAPARLEARPHATTCIDCAR